MEWELNRYEKILNEDNSIKEIFISVRLFEDKVLVWEQGYWLTSTEIDLVINDEQSLNSIINRVGLLGEDALIGYRLEPPIEESIEEPIEE